MNPSVIPSSEVVDINPAPRLPLSLVIVSYNQAQYLEQAIQSVLSQKYPNLQLIVADGGSKDGSVDIIRRHESSLAGWFSERDRGQSHALNKAFKMVTGEVCNWLCSDDFLLPGSLEYVGEFFGKNPKVDVLAGGCHYQFDKHPEWSCNEFVTEKDLTIFPARNPVFQPSCFFRRRLCPPGDFLRENLHYTMDWELWCRFLKEGAHWAFTDKILGVYRVTGENKTFVGGSKILRELELVYREYSGELIPLTLWFRLLWLPLVKYAQQRAGKIDGQLANFTGKVLYRMARQFYPSSRCEELRMQYRLYGIEQEKELHRQT